MATPPFPKISKDHIRTDLETRTSNLKCVALTVLELLTFNAQIADSRIALCRQTLSANKKAVLWQR